MPLYLPPTQVVIDRQIFEPADRSDRFTTISVPANALLVLEYAEVDSGYSAPIYVDLYKHNPRVLGLRHAPPHILASPLVYAPYFATLASFDVDVAFPPCTFRFHYYFITLQ